MKIKFSRHARRRMKWRKIEENEVREAIINPEKLEDSIKGRKNAFKKVEGRSLKVTYLSGHRDEITVITTIVTENNT